MKFFIGWTSLLLLTTIGFFFYNQRNLDDYKLRTSKDSLEDQASIYLAHLMWNQILNIDPQLNKDLVIQTLKDLANGQILIDEKTCLMTLMELQSRSIEVEAKENLFKSEQILSNLSQDPEIRQIIPHKLFYRILKIGNGSPLSSESIPLVHFIEYDMNQREVFSTYGKRPQRLVLSDCLMGFAKGVENMQVGEKRRIYAHPSLVYQKFGKEEHPQQMVIFDVEVINP
jgi:FKBP-type peptidyl-prolyl cis-trans isomerase